MRHGKSLRERTEALGFTNPDWDERVHDVLDALARVRDVAEECQSDVGGTDDTRWNVGSEILKALKPL